MRCYLCSYCGRCGTDLKQVYGQFTEWVDGGGWTFVRVSKYQSFYTNVGQDLVHCNLTCVVLQCSPPFAFPFEKPTVHLVKLQVHAVYSIAFKTGWKRG